MICAASIRMGIGSFRVPGPGLLPFLAGAAVGLLALLLVVTEALRKEEGPRVGEFWTGARWKKVVLVAVSLLLYAVVLSRLGYLIATFALMTLLFSVLGSARLWVRVLAALVTVLLTYSVFRIWLDVQLPKGLFGS